MDAAYIATKQTELDRRMAAIAAGVGRDAIYDGIISPEHYSSSIPKVLWLAREPNDTGGDYDYKSDIRNKISAGIRLKGKRYFDPMRYTLYAAQNGHADWDSIPTSDASPEIARLVLNVAFVNCSKIPGGAKVNWETWWRHVELFKDVVFEQISLANPDVIICVGTRNYLEQYGYLAGASKMPKSYRHFYKKGKQLVFDCYHLAYLFPARDYFNDIVDVLRMELGSAPR